RQDRRQGDLRQGQAGQPRRQGLRNNAFTRNNIRCAAARKPDGGGAVCVSETETGKGGGPSMQTISVRRTLAQLARQPLYWAGLAALLALGYAYAMGTSAVGVDDLAIATYQQGGGFLRQSRITEWLVQALTGLLAYQRFWPEFWAAVCLALAGTGLAAVVYTA